MLRNAIWYSRDEPTPAQHAEIEGLGYLLVGIEKGMELGAMNLDSDEAVDQAVLDVMSLVACSSAVSIFGVFSTPILQRMNRTAEQAVFAGEWVETNPCCFAAWKNVQRTPEGGGKETFQHLKWCLVGTLGW